MGSLYQPTTRPGHRLPHAWLECNGKGLSTHDLTEVGGRFALLTDAYDGVEWADAVQLAEEKYRVRITLARIGDGGDYRDVSGQWANLCGLEPGGAILARPDNHVGWRSTGRVSSPAKELSAALGIILAR